MPDFGDSATDKKSSDVSSHKTQKIDVKDIQGSSRKPFPWPFFLALLLPSAFLGILAWELNQRNYTLGIRLGWDLLNSFIPGFSIMVLIGAIAQFRKRPILSFVSFLLGCLFLVGSYWGVQKFLEYRWLN
jgi:hypothetical protein